MYFPFSGQCHRGFAHQKTCQEKAVMPTLTAMLRTPVITSVTNHTVSILFFPPGTDCKAKRPAAELMSIIKFALIVRTKELI